ncbi:MAG: hypothetical protein ABH827_00010 [bacterium]
MKKKLLLCLSFLALFCTKTYAYDFGYFNSEKRDCSSSVEKGIKNDKETYKIFTPKEFYDENKCNIKAIFLSRNGNLQEKGLQLDHIETANCFCFSLSINPHKFIERYSFIVAASRSFWCNTKISSFTQEIINLTKKYTSATDICNKIGTDFCKKLEKKESFTIALIIFEEHEGFEEIFFKN